MASVWTGMLCGGFTGADQRANYFTAAGYKPK